MFKFLIFIFSPKFYFLDLILKELSKSFGYFVSEADLVVIVTRKTTYTKRLNLYFTVIKSFIDSNNETHFVKLACQYLHENKLIEISQTPTDDVKYSLTYEGLITINSGGLFWSKLWSQLKASLQYFVWIVAILSFVVNCENTQKYNTVNRKIDSLQHSINQSKLLYEQKLKELQLKSANQLQVQENLVKIDTVYLKPHK